MGTVTLLLGIHNHQPQGNFDHVFAQGYEDCYWPLLQTIQRHRGIQISLHHSGPLIEWIEQHHPGYFDLLAELVTTGRVEVLGGGFYEPMLSVLPERDASGQLALMASFLEERVRHRPQGMWLAERVWEPDLPRVIGGAGYRYTVVDDGHFLAAGMTRPLRGYYVTDKAGIPLCLFPISRELRYTIPFKPVQETIDYLLRVADEAGDQDIVITYGDDGEKFGMWPGTKSWVWDEGWLEHFFDALEQHSDRIRTSTFSAVLEQRPPSGRVYLPTASYDEMSEWTLPPEAQQRLHGLTHAVRDKGHSDDWGPFVRGGIWQGFLAKYPEANFLHKRMCYVSGRVAAAGQLATSPAQRDLLERGTRELYRGQCNCAYWHGLFGGLYLPKLRSAVHTHLIRADVCASQLLGNQQQALEKRDLDGDLCEEVILTGSNLGVVVSPTRGGALLAIDDRPRSFCITDVLTRRPEAYHAKVRELAQPQAAAEHEGPLSIHEITALKEEGLGELLLYDPHQRLAFVDQFFGAELDLQQLQRCEPPERGDFKNGRYDLLEAGASRVVLGRRGLVRSADGPIGLSLRKRLQLEGPSLCVSYELLPERPLSAMYFATELSVALPHGPHPEVSYSLCAPDHTERASITSAGVAQAVSRMELQDPLAQLSIGLELTPAATIVRFPLETVSQSESGIERNYQGSTLVLLWPCAGEASMRPTVRLTLH